MSQYYYLIPSLPDIRSDAEAPITYDEFLILCESNVNTDTMERLRNLTLGTTEGPFMNEWGSFYNSLTRELNAQRSARLGRQYTSDYEKNSDCSQVVQSALSAQNPLEAERLLLSYQFDTIDMLVGCHSFDDVYLFGYAIKLKLLERQSSFVKTRGEAEFKRLFEKVQQSIYNL